MRIILSILILISSHSVVAKPPKWILAARKLIGYPGDKRLKAIKYLKSDKKLNEKIEKHIDGKYRYYVLDIIVALALPGWEARLKEEIERDEDGFSTLALNALLTKENQKDICNTYVQILQKEERRKKVSPAAIIAMLDTLGRLRYKLNDLTVDALLSHPFYEVRQSLVSYLRNSAKHDPRQLKKFVGQIQRNPYQIRIQFLYAWAEVLPAGQFEAVRECQRDKNRNVLKVCSDLMVLASKKDIPKAKPEKAKPTKAAKEAV